jgi:hypothetical protein
MKVTCPKCESEDVQRLAMIYQHGTATSVSTGSTLGAVGDDLAVAGTVTSGKQQSLLAQQAAPPQPRGNSGCLLITGILLVAFGLLAPFVTVTRMADNRDVSLLPVGIVVIVVGIILLVLSRARVRNNAEYNRTTYARLKERWDRTWLCLRCGSRFEANL